jgi:uncharacterized protein
METATVGVRPRGDVWTRYSAEAQALGVSMGTYLRRRLESRTASPRASTRSVPPSTRRPLPTVPARAYDLAVRRSEVIDFFRDHREDLRRLGISSLLVFGSVARDQARADSDIDLIAEFDRPIGYLGLARVQHELERLLGCGVDLATPGMIRSEYRDRIYAEAVRAA